MLAYNVFFVFYSTSKPIETNKIFLPTRNELLADFVHPALHEIVVWVRVAGAARSVDGRNLEQNICTVNPKIDAGFVYFEYSNF